jgi:hypothetical protein
MEPIERELSERKARLTRLAADVRRLLLERMHEVDDDRKLRLYREIATLRYEIGQTQAGIAELENIIAEGRLPPRISRPPMPKARRLGVAERQRLEKETRDAVLKSFGNPEDVVVDVHVGKTSDEKGNPQIQIVTRTLRPGQRQDD